MVRWGSLAVAGLLTMGIGVVTAPRAEACYMCTPQFGCSTTPTGFLNCTTWYVFGTPVCLASGNCTPWPFGGGLPSDGFPKIARPVWNSAPTAVEAELNVYSVLMSCTSGCGLFEPGQTSRVVHGGVHALTPDAMIGEVSRIRGASSGDWPVLGTGVTVGLGQIESAAAGRDGNGFLIRAQRTAQGASVSVCRVEARTPGQALATEELGPHDLLLVRTWIDERECVLALATSRLETGDDQAEVMERRRASFIERGRLMGLRSPRLSTFQLTPIDLGGAACR